MSPLGRLLLTICNNDLSCSSREINQVIQLRNKHPKLWRNGKLIKIKPYRSVQHAANHLGVLLGR